MLAATSMLVAACGGGSSEKDSTGGTLTLGVDVAPRSWDPAQQVSAGTGVVLWQPVYDTLLKYAPDGSIEPNAAESFSYNEDRTALTLKLRDGMTFTDGAAVDAAAAKASLEHMRDSAGPDSVRLAGVQVEALDDRTVELSTERPNALLAQFLTWAPGILASPASLASPDLATNPVGSGPYTFASQESTSGTSLVYQRNPNYWNADAYPYDRVVIRVMEDETARLNALRSGQIDAGPVSAANADQAESAGLMLLGNAVNWNGMFIMDRDGKQVPALGDVRVRQAMNKVFDRDAIVKAIYQGHGVVNNQIFNTNSDAYKADLLAASAYDVEAAKKLMNDAGYSGGFDLTIPEIPGRTDMLSPIIKQQLGLIGINVNIESVPATQYLDRFLKGVYPVIPFGLPSGTPVADVDASLAPNAIWNVFKTQDPKLTQLVADLQVAPEDKQKEIVQSINEFVTDQAWFSVLAFPESFWAFKGGVSAEKMTGNSAPYLYTFK
ncbi:ABC transporter substrate-binding protein [Rhodococcus sp. GB-02]